MNSLRTMVIDKLKEQNGLSDEELAYDLRNWVPSAQAVSLICRQLEAEGILKRIKRIGKPNGNYLVDEESAVIPKDVSEQIDIHIPNEDELPVVPKGQEHIRDLQQLGFKWVGDFTVNHEGMNFFVGENNEVADIILALTIDGAVVYLANSTRSLGQTLATLSGNSPPHGLQKYNNYLRATLQRHKSVQIYILKDPGGLHYVGHKLSLCAGLLPSLMDFFRPVWNKNVNDWAA
jgi:hypothetical protein